MSAPSFLAPEVVQSSAMDCGPAALISLLEGFDLRVSYGRLREACQTDVDGTSIDTLEDVARALGLDAEQVVVPADHVLEGEAETLPALAVLTLPSGAKHFAVIWRVLGPWVQIMDPSSGRIWMGRDKLLRQLYQHTMPVPAAAWREWAGGEEFLAVLRARLAALGCRRAFVSAQIEAALADPSWAGLARLDAGARMLADMIELGALARGAELERSLLAILERAAEDPRWIPDRCWSARALPPEAQAEYGCDEELVLLAGAVLLRVRGRRDPAEADAMANPDDDAPAPVIATKELTGEELRPGRELWRRIAQDGLLRPAALAGAVLAASVGLLVEAAILRGMMEIGTRLGLARERLVAWAALVVFAFVLLLLEAVISGELKAMGRRLELRLRLAFLRKLPRLGARYFQSRLSSDMAERIHAMHGLRRLPSLGEQILRDGASLLLTVAGVAWLDPGGALVAGGGAALLVLAALAALPTLRERDLRFRSHGGALSRVYLDALLGLWPLRSHGAGRALRREHEQLLVEWARAGLDLLRASVTVELLQGLVGVIVVVTVVARHSLAAGEVGATLLLIYWSMQLPALGQKLGASIRQYPAHRSRALRLLEPLGAPDEEQLGLGPSLQSQESKASEGLPGRGPLALRFEGVEVVAGGHRLLEHIDLEIGAGEHVAIVGASGAGKSTLVGSLLGWHRPARGRILVAGAPLEGRRLAELRRRCAWIDPAVALWNDPLVDNLIYGAGDAQRALDEVGPALATAQLRELVAKLPEGLQTELGEGGGLLSGGEGQRVRLGRALLRSEIGLAILDEPLRGLDRSQRAALLRRLRARWADTTLLCVSHDLEETREFPRVIVIDGGRIVEDGDPRSLARDPDSRYATMLAEERAVHERIWGGSQWRRIEIRDGQLRATPRPEEAA